MLLSRQTYDFSSCETGKMQDPLQVGEDEFKKLVNINFVAPWFLLKAVGRRMKESKAGGSIVFLTSIIGAERGLYPGAAAYGACAASIHQLVRVSTFQKDRNSFLHILFLPKRFATN